ncbi:hypothetical protein [Coleofasciculus sp. E1-EBD-02]|uniref:hypothetical protein n=1 Tax=Coleofasciculus sp. E1-EBD-02 TaxID=3068481 RepID=UPI0032F74208
MTYGIDHWSLVIGHLSLVIGHWSFVIRYLSLVIGHWSFVICHWSFVEEFLHSIGAGLVTSGWKPNANGKTRPYKQDRFCSQSRDNNQY